MKKLVIAILTIVSLAFAPTAMAEENWKPPQPREMYSATHQYVLIADNSLRHTTVMWWEPKDGSKGSVCTESGKQQDCGTKSQGYINGHVILPTCGAVLESCIEKLWIYKSGSSPTEAKFLRTTQSIPFKGEPSLGIPSGGGVSLFQSDIFHSGGNGLYAVAPKMQIYVEGNSVNVNRLDVDVAAVNELSAPQAGGNDIENPCDPRGGWAKTKITCPSGGGSFEGNDRCFYIERGLCGTPQRIPEDLVIGVQLKLTNKVAGWFSGRLKSPSIQVTKIDPMYNTVQVQAQPVEVPRFYAETDTTKGDPDINTLLRPGDSFGKDALFTDFGSTNNYAPKVISLLREKVKDTSAGTSSLWNFYTTGVAANNRSECLADRTRVLGVVTTNAMAYLGTAPEFTNGFLQYKVAGLHFMPDGKTPVQGTYDLVMRSEIARCLYGFSSAPISATIEVTGGESLQVATTTVKEKDGWLKLSAYGFGFSDKTIKAKVQQSKTKGTITCIKGKQVKKVSGISPRCPSGFKAKY